MASEAVDFLVPEVLPVAAAFGGGGDWVAGGKPGFFTNCQDGQVSMALGLAGQIRGKCALPGSCHPMLVESVLFLETLRGALRN